MSTYYEQMKCGKTVEKLSTFHKDYNRLIKGLVKIDYI